MNIEDHVQSVFREVFKDKDLVLSEEMTANDIEGWDSITHMKLISDIESSFNLEFSYKEVRTLSCIKDLITLIKSKTN